MDPGAAGVPETSGLSLHDLIRGEIEERIMSGDWLPGYRIPYEHDLKARYGCSRMTVSKALSTLVEIGLLERRKRAGTFVAAPTAHRAALDFKDIRADIIESGRRHTFELIDRDERTASASDKKMLSIKGGKVLSLTNVHYADDRPFALERRLINLTLVPDAGTADFGTIPSGAWLLAHVPWSDAHHRVSAVSANGETALRLGLPSGRACVSLERWTWRLPERITYVHQVYAEENYALDAYFRI